MRDEVSDSLNSNLPGLRHYDIEWGMGTVYLKRLEAENVGPVRNLLIEPRGVDESTPRPIVLVGPNGTGKTITLSLVANWLFAMQQELYRNPDVTKNQVFRIRSGGYVSAGEEYSSAYGEFEGGFRFAEWQMRKTRTEFEKDLSERDSERLNRLKQMYGYAILSGEGRECIHHELAKNVSELRPLFESRCQLYFPANRHEVPAWLNENALGACYA